LENDCELTQQTLESQPAINNLHRTGRMPVDFEGDSMSTRQAYFDDLLNDCLNSVEEAGIPEEQKGVVVAALIQSDSYNGLRKALIQVQVLRSHTQLATGGDR
jgi:hypothetical protein